MSNKDMPVNFSQKSLTPNTAKVVVTNIGQLFECLAVGWTENGFNRILIAGDDGQFIRVPGQSREHNYCAPWKLDIPVIYGTTPRQFNHPFLRGFIGLDMPHMFPGMFICKFGDHNVWASAELTKSGYEYAVNGVLDLPYDHPDLKRNKFFNPEARDFSVIAIAAEAALAELEGRG